MADIQYIDLNNVPDKESLSGLETFQVAESSDPNWSKTNLNAVKDFANEDILIALDTKANVDSVYSKQESDTQLASKANLVHTHNISDIINLQTILDQLNVIKSYNRIFAKTTSTNETIPANTSIRILDRVTLQTGGVVS